ncbi:MAG: hypothetical protein ACFUZC_02185 [Chthoniobacteraceae bacterium]
MTPCPCFPIATPLEEWSDIDAAFAQAPDLPLLQPWRATPEESFRPAFARLGYAEGVFCVKVELKDDDVFNPISGFNEPAYKSGDVVEVFAYALGNPRYCEIHTTPGGSLLQLRFRVDQPRIPQADSLVAAPVSRVLTRRTPAGWSAFFEIPSKITGSFPRPGGEWRVAVCRYDYTRGRARPVLSSTAALGKVDFHQIENWTPIVFQ